jgi:uncharacterized protein (TIGR02145 family)
MLKRTIKMKSKIIFAFIVCVANISKAQVKVGDNSSTINSNSILESTNKGILLSRVALTSTNNASPLSAFVAGMMVYNTATAGTAPNNVTPGTYFSDGVRWIRVGNEIEASKWTNNTTNTQIELSNLSNGTTIRPSGTQLVVSDAGNVGIGTAIPQSSALLDLSSTSSGFLPPRMTNSQMKAIVNPIILTVYNTTLNCLAYHVNGSFNCSHNTPVTTAPNAPLGSTYTTHYNGILSGGVHVGGTETQSTQTTGETFDQNTTCTTKMISAQGCDGLTQVVGASGTVYPLVNINGQCWMQTNLKEIPSNFADYTHTSWLATTSPDEGYWGYYNTTTTNGTAGWGISEPAANEGLLYQWSAAMDNSITERSRGICPKGFHIPSDCEWMYLEHGQGMSNAEQNRVNAWRAVAADNEGTPSLKLRSQGIGQTNASGFSGLLAGFRESGGTFNTLPRSSNSSWWTSTPISNIGAFVRVLFTNFRGVYRVGFVSSNSLSVRCLKD